MVMQEAETCCTKQRLTIKSQMKTTIFMLSYFTILIHNGAYKLKFTYEIKNKRCYVSAPPVCLHIANREKLPLPLPLMRRKITW